VKASDAENTAVALNPKDGEKTDDAVKIRD
jgi:hypothetical protein